MTGCEIAEKLRQLNRWRRGDDETLIMPDPAAIGRWIDAAADALEEQDKRAAELARVTAEMDNLLKEVAFLNEWRDCLAGVQMTEAHFDSTSGVQEASAALARAESADLVQEACGGRCGDPHCDLSTEGELMRTPADPFPCRSDPLCKGTDYKAAPAKQGGSQ